MPVGQKMQNVTFSKSNRKLMFISPLFQNIRNTKCVSGKWKYFIMYFLVYILFWKRFCRERDDGFVFQFPSFMCVSLFICILVPLPLGTMGLSVFCDLIGTASTNAVEFRGIRPQMYIKDLL